MAAFAWQAGRGRAAPRVGKDRGGPATQTEAPPVRGGSSAHRWTCASPPRGPRHRGTRTQGLWSASGRASEQGGAAERSSGGAGASAARTGASAANSQQRLRRGQARRLTPVATSPCLGTSSMPWESMLAGPASCLRSCGRGRGARLSKQSARSTVEPAPVGGSAPATPRPCRPLGKSGACRSTLLAHWRRRIAAPGTAQGHGGSRTSDAALDRAPTPLKRPLGPSTACFEGWKHARRLRPRFCGDGRGAWALIHTPPPQQRLAAHLPPWLEPQLGVRPALTTKGSERLPLRALSLERVAWQPCEAMVARAGIAWGAWHPTCHDRLPLGQKAFLQWPPGGRNGRAGQLRPRFDVRDARGTADWAAIPSVVAAGWSVHDLGRGSRASQNDLRHSLQVHEVPRNEWAVQARDGQPPYQAIRKLEAMHSRRQP